MKDIFRTLIHWLPFAFSIYLCYTTLWRLSASQTAAWGPAFYAFLPMCFFFGGLITFRLDREIRELRRQIAKIGSMPTAGSAAA